MPIAGSSVEVFLQTSGAGASIKTNTELEKSIAGYFGGALSYEVNKSNLVRMREAVNAKSLCWSTRAPLVRPKFRNKLHVTIDPAKYKLGCRPLKTLRNAPLLHGFIGRDACGDIKSAKARKDRPW